MQNKIALKNFKLFVQATSDILRNFSEQALAELARLKSMQNKGMEEDFSFLM